MLLPTNRKTSTLWCFLAAVLVVSDNSSASESKPFIHHGSEATATIVLIMDDMGNNLELGRRAIALPGAINYAFLPHSNYGFKLANEAYRQDKEILLHAPMSNVTAQATGPGTLTPAMNQQQFLHTLKQDLQSIPHVSGVNNHMGSLLTQLQQPMEWLMASLKQQNLYFIDSRTSPLTVAEKQAHKQQLPVLRRDIFLDNQLQTQALALQFSRLIKRAKRNGNAVAIAHPHPETIEFLEQALPTLEGQGIQMILASERLAAKRCLTNNNACALPLNLAKYKTTTADK